MVMARWPWPRSFPGSASPAAIAAATRSASKHAHRAVALGLQDEAAVEFEARAEHHRQHDGLAEQFCHRRRVIMAAQDGIDRGTEPYDAAAHVERLDRERQDRVIESGLIGLANRNG
jgi:hypothetical protein